MKSHSLIDISAEHDARERRREGEGGSSHHVLHMVVAYLKLSPYDQMLHLEQNQYDLL